MFLNFAQGMHAIFTARNSYGAVDLFYMPDSSWTHWMVKSVREVDSDILGRFGDPRWSCLYVRRFRGETSQLIVMVTDLKGSSVDR